MRFQTPLVVVVGLLLGLVVLARWGEAAAGRAPTWLTAPDTIPPERILWEGVAVPLEEDERRKTERLEAEWPEAEQKEAEQREAERLKAERRKTERRKTERREAQLQEIYEWAKRTKAEPAAIRWRVQQLRATWAVEDAIAKGHQVGAAEMPRPRDIPRREPPFNPQAAQIVRIGLPESWRLSDLYSPERMPLLMQAQLQAADFYLIRLACSFRPVLGQSRVDQARFHVFLERDSQGRQPIAYDISPLDITQEVKRQLKFTLAPTLKFRTVVEAELASLEFILEYPELHPIIVGAGVGETMPTWDYNVATGMAHIQGAKMMHLLVKAPKGMPVVTAQLTLTAQLYVESRASWLPILWGRVSDRDYRHVQLWPEPQEIP